MKVSKPEQEDTTVSQPKDGTYDNWGSDEARLRVAEVAAKIYFSKLSISRNEQVPDLQKNWKLYRDHLEAQRTQ